ncbi:MAG: restriction endonuclease [Nitrospira sp.]|nr:restriction endonuclease [Nitrospira sp.]MDH4242829.1 restriction endonuclease [Nitrospira sp.]MDH4355758.1 restriction endonuclease [Nitrospira sp.]MDH5317974.1 restriction endonuclease [Nitrospira sp.]
MAIPDYQTVMLPLLQFLKDGKEHNIGEVVNSLAAEFKLSTEERQQFLGSGQQTVIRNRAGWARTYLKKAGLLESTRRGFFRITEQGRSVLALKPGRIDVKYLEQFPEFVTFRELRHDRADEVAAPINSSTDATPEEALDTAYARLRLDLEGELLDQVKSASPSFFERLVVELLVRMGYGGTLRDAGQAVGKSGDGGIDGIIKEDRLGLDVIYIQAKRWDSTVGRPEIQKFAGALQGHRARKGVFITTSSFSSDALDFASKIDSKIVLIDGPALAKYMIDHNVGVSPARTYEVKKIDSDYFNEE